MSLAVTVRPVRQSDFDQWLPLWDGYNAFYGRSGATALPAEITQTTWARFFDPHEPVHALVLGELALEIERVLPVELGGRLGFDRRVGTLLGGLRHGGGLLAGGTGGRLGHYSPSRRRTRVAGCARLGLLFR